MNKRIWLGIGLGALALLWTAVWWIGQAGQEDGNGSLTTKTSPPRRDTLHEGSTDDLPATTTPRQPVAAKQDSRSAVPATRRRPVSGGLELVRTDAAGSNTTEALDYYGDNLPGFVPVKENEPLRVRFVWPYADKLVTVTRMDGGRFVSGDVNRINVPVNERGEVEFGFQIGPEPGRYQLELMGRSGGVEAFGFWAGEPTGKTMPASGLEFVDPPLRKRK